MIFKALQLLKPRTAPKVQERVHEVAGRSLPLKVVRNDRARRLTLRIDSGGRGLRITVPPGTVTREVDQFLRRHQGWLVERLARTPENPQVRPGIEIPVRGLPHRIVHAASARGTVRVGLDDGAPTLLVSGGIDHLPRRVADFLKREARHDIEPLVRKHCGSIGKRASAIRFRDTTSRWGSCSSAGALSFSWRILMAPPAVIDYLVAHEVAHLREMNHGPDFWKLCATLCPDTERCKAWLKKNGGALQAIVFE